MNYFKEFYNCYYILILMIIILSAYFLFRLKDKLESSAGLILALILSAMIVTVLIGGYNIEKFNDNYVVIKKTELNNKK